MAQRFSRNLVRTEIDARVKAVEAKAVALGEHFTVTNGWDQVKGKGEDLNRLFGEWQALKQIWRSLC